MTFEIIKALFFTALGVAIAIAYNAWKPNKFDKITKDAATKVKDL